MQTASQTGSLAPFTEAWLRAAAARHLHRLDAPPDRWGASDVDLNPDIADAVFGGGAPVPAAVLVPVVARDALSVILTERTGHLPSHAGQIAFPGGKIDAGDSDAVAAALREAEEEIGLEPAMIEPLGLLDPYRTGTGYLIQPVVALVAPGHRLTLNPGEVADAFEVPLAFLLDAANHQRHSREWKGGLRHFYAMPYEERFIWGATAGMIRNMHERLRTQ